MMIRLIWKELLLLSRDLHGLVMLFVMPVAFMLIMSIALSNEDNPYADTKIALSGSVNNPINLQLIEELKQQQLELEFFDESAIEPLKQQLHQGKWLLLIYNPNTDFNDLSNDKPLELLIKPSIDRTWILSVKGLLSQHYTQLRLKQYIDGFDKKRLAKNQMMFAVDAPDIEELESFFQHDRIVEQYIVQQGSVTQKPNSVQQSVPAWLIFGMFFILIPLSNVMAMEKQTNTITRLRLANTSASQLLLAKLIPYFFINMMQFLLMILLGKYVLPWFGVSALMLTGSFFNYLLLAAAISLSALGYGFFVSVIAKSTEHAVVLGGGGIIIMAALGGIMVPSYVMPTMMQFISQLSPMSWGLSGFHHLLLDHYSFSQILNFVGLLLGFFALFMGLTVIIYNKELRKNTRL